MVFLQVNQLTIKLTDEILIELFLDRISKAREHFEESGGDFEKAKEIPFDSGKTSGVKINPKHNKIH